MFPYIKKDVVITLTIQSGLEQELRNCTVDLLRDILDNPNKKGQLPRDDYKELAELTLVLLGENVLNFSFKQPGAHHKARFMANVIYAAKMFALQHLDMDWKLMEQDDIAMEIEFDSLYKNNLERFVKFTSLVYVPYFMVSSIGVDAPLNDLELYKLLLKYNQIDTELSEVALKAFSRH